MRRTASVASGDLPAAAKAKKLRRPWLQHAASVTGPGRRLAAYRSPKPAPASARFPVKRADGRQAVGFGGRDRRIPRCGPGAAAVFQRLLPEPPACAVRDKSVTTSAKMRAFRQRCLTMINRSEMIQAAPSAPHELGGPFGAVVRGRDQLNALGAGGGQGHGWPGGKVRLTKCTLKLAAALAFRWPDGLGDGALSLCLAGYMPPPPPPPCRRRARA